MAVAPKLTVAIRNMERNLEVKSAASEEYGPTTAKPFLRSYLYFMAGVDFFTDYDFCFVILNLMSSRRIISPGYFSARRHRRSHRIHSKVENQM